MNKSYNPTPTDIAAFSRKMDSNLFIVYISQWKRQNRLSNVRIIMFKKSF